MTLDDETAARIADEKARERGDYNGVGQPIPLGEYVRAGWDARDAEVEELRAENDRLRDRQAEVDKRSEDSRTTANLAYAQRERMQFERDAALATLAKVADLLGSLDLDSDHLTAPGTAWGSILRESLALARGADESPTERETPADGHVHDWKRRQNVTTHGYAMPPYWACECGAAREVCE